MDYNEQITLDFYTAYAKYLAQAGLNGVSASLTMETNRVWFGFGHRAGVGLLSEGVKQYVALLQKYGNHSINCPQHSLYPAECICGWENTLRTINDGTRH
jgi:hypothetical protein